MQAPIVEFSQLSVQEKQKYIDFLMNNNVKFEDRGNKFIAKIKLVTNENMNVSNLSKSPREAKENCFTLAKKSSRNISQREERSLTPRTPLKGKPNKIQTSRILPNIEQTYPEFYRFIKQQDVWIRPRRQSKEQLMQQIEEIYSLKFQEATHKIQTKQDSILEMSFPQYVYENLRLNSKSESALNQKALDFIASIDHHSVKYNEVATFQKFLSQSYHEEDLMFYLFVRAILEKELGVVIYSKFRKTVIDLSQILLTMKQIQQICESVYGNDEGDQINQMIIICQNRLRTTGKKKISALEYIDIALQKYFIDRSEKSLTFIKADEINKQSITDIETTVSEVVFEQLQNFLEDQVGTKDIQSEIHDVITSLLKSIFRYDKMIWFQRINQDEPTQNELLYIENLQKSYRKMQRNGPPIQDIEIFAKRVLQTPKLARIIGMILESD